MERTLQGLMRYGFLRSFSKLVTASFLFLLLSNFKTSACDVWLSNGYGEDIGNSITRYPGYATGIFLSGCTFTSPFSPARIYIIANSPATAQGMNGSALVDVGGNPNLINSFLACGLIMDELIGNTNQITAGEYDIVFDYNLNGIFDYGTDCITSPGSAFTFRVVDAQSAGGLSSPFPPPYVIASNIWMNRIKARAFEQHTELAEINYNWELYMALVNLGGVLNPGASDGYAWGVGQFWDKVKSSIAFTIQRYLDISNDPPRFDYNILAKIDTLTIENIQQIDRPLHTHTAKLNTLTAIEERCLAAELLSLERFQGAMADSSAEYAYMQMVNLTNLMQLRKQIYLQKISAWNNLKNEAISLGKGGLIDVAEAVLTRNNIITNGFNAEQQLYLQSHNYRPYDMDILRAEIFNSNIEQLQGQTLSGMIDGFITTETTLLDSLNVSIDSTRSLAGFLSNLVNMSPLLPDFDIQAPASAVGRNDNTPGTAVIMQYNDINQTGTPISTTDFFTYRDTTHTPASSISYIPMDPGFDLVRCKIELANSLTAYSYHLLEITPGIISPKIISASPDSFFIVAAPQDTALFFKVTNFTVPSGFQPVFKWYVNDLLYLQGSSDSFLFPMLNCSDMMYTVRVELSDNAAGNYGSTKEWLVKVTGNSANCANQAGRKNASHWYFGSYAAIKFGGPQPVALTNSAMEDYHGVATMSDEAGNLLFYTNGVDVWNRNHTIMPNGSGLNGTGYGQKVIILPYPGKANKYFIVTSGWEYDYSVVDMTLDNGNGDIIPTEKNIQFQSNYGQRLAAVYAPDQRSIWLVTFSYFYRNFYTYLINENGFMQTPVVSEENDFNYYDISWGYMKISPDGKKLAFALGTNYFALFDFDNTTGRVSNKRLINAGNLPYPGISSYGIEFSPNSKIIYITDGHSGQNGVTQLEISSDTVSVIEASAVQLPFATTNFALQLGPDGKIYVTASNQTHLGVIHRPNKPGLACNYDAAGVYLEGKLAQAGLPGYISSTLIKNEIQYTGICAYYPTNFWLDRDTFGIINVLWNFGDTQSPSNSQTGLNTQRTYNTAGEYEVRCIVTYDTGGVYYDTIYADITIHAPDIEQSGVKYFHTNPSCNDSIMLAAATFGDGYQWYRNGVSIPGATGLSYFANQSGSYGVEIKSINGCAALRTDTVNIIVSYPHPTLVLNLPQVSTQTFSSYQWYRNSTLLQGQTSQSTTPTLTGSYHVVVTDQYGCTGTSNVYQHTVSSVAEREKDMMQVYPNPSDGIFMVEVSLNAPVQFQITDVAGRIVAEGILNKNKNIVELKNVESGIYFLKTSVSSVRLMKY